LQIGKKGRKSTNGGCRKKNWVPAGELSRIDPKIREKTKTEREMCTSLANDTAEELTSGKVPSTASDKWGGQKCGSKAYTLLHGLELVGMQKKSNAHCKARMRRKKPTDLDLRHQIEGGRVNRPFHCSVGQRGPVRKTEGGREVVSHQMMCELKRAKKSAWGGVRRRLRYGWKIEDQSKTFQTL